jgi:hypothetical protein
LSCHSLFIAFDSVALIPLSNINSPTAVMPKKPCFCQPLHYGCDKASCSDAPPAGADLTTSTVMDDDESDDSDESYNKLFTCTWGALVDASDAGCSTCQIIRQGVRATEEWTDLDKEQSVYVRRQKGAVFLHFWPWSPPRHTVFECRQTSQSGMYLADLRGHHQLHPLFH